MNTKAKAIQAIISFLNSNEKVLMLTGTYQHEKHPLILRLVFSNFPSPANVLFRANSAQNFGTFLSTILKLTKKPRTGSPLTISGGYRLHVDTINPASWGSSPREVDVAIVYPIDSLKWNEAEACVQNLLGKNARKIFLVSWTDNKDYSWADQFKPVKVIYDAEEEDPEYHKRMLEYLSDVSPSYSPRGVPDYASNTPTNLLIQILCRGTCNGTRWAVLNKPYPGESALKSADMFEFTATCLKCGYVASDNYNWFR